MPHWNPPAIVLSSCLSLALLGVSLAPVALADSPGTDAARADGSTDALWVEVGSDAQAGDTALVTFRADGRVLFVESVTLLGVGVIPDPNGSEADTGTSRDPVGRAAKTGSGLDPDGAPLGPGGDPNGVPSKSGVGVDPDGVAGGSGPSIEPFGTSANATSSLDPNGAPSGSNHYPNGVPLKTGVVSDPNGATGETGPKIDPIGGVTANAGSSQTQNGLPLKSGAINDPDGTSLGLQLTPNVQSLWSGAIVDPDGAPSTAGSDPNGAPSTAGSDPNGAPFAGMTWLEPSARGAWATADRGRAFELLAAHPERLATLRELARERSVTVEIESARGTEIWDLLALEHQTLAPETAPAPIATRLVSTAEASERSDTTCAPSARSVQTLERLHSALQYRQCHASVDTSLPQGFYGRYLETYRRVETTQSVDSACRSDERHVVTYPRGACWRLDVAAPGCRAMGTVLSCR